MKLKYINSRIFYLIHVIIKIMKTLLLISLLALSLAYEYDGDVMVLTEETFE